MKTLLLFLFSLNITGALLSQSINTAQESNTASKSQLSQICNFTNLPIVSTRTISFTTDEASYIDVDASPDGKLLLFSFLGNLYSLPVEGGIARQITRGLAINRCPVWSPDGNLIAYESDASGFIRLHVDDTAGTFHKILGEDLDQKTNLDPKWFPDSKQIAVYTDVHHLTGIRSMLPKEIENLLGFSQNGKFIYYLNQIAFNRSAIIQLDRFSGEKRNVLLLNEGANDLVNARISPDGNVLTYIKYAWFGRADSLMKVDIITGKVSLLQHLNIKFPGFLGRQHYSFSKDSKYLFIGYGGKIHRIELTSGKSNIVPFRAEVKFDMGPLNYNKFQMSLDSFNVKYVRSVRRSPDGKQLVFSALNKIYVMDLPHGAPRVLVNQSINQFQPVYSPDGKWIAYVSWKDDEGGYVWRIPSKGGTAEKITFAAGLYMEPSWSPNSEQIVVAKGANKLGMRNMPGIGQIQIISLNDKTIKTIADSVPLFNQPAFLSDNKHVVFKPNQMDSDKKLWPRLQVKNIDSGGQRVLVCARKNYEDLFPIRQIKLSPDGRFVIFMYNEDLYFVPMSNIEEPQTIFDENSNIPLIRFARGCIDPNWEEGGRVLSWINVNTYYRIDPDKIITAAEGLNPNEIERDLSKRKIIDVDIKPDDSVRVVLKASSLYSRSIVALKNARIITMHGDYVIEHGIILIKNGKIISVGQAGKVAIPKHAKVINLFGKTIMPGLIDMHSHMYEAVPPDVFLEQSWQQLLNFSFGVTTARDPSGSYDTFGYGELLETGQMIGPRLFTVGDAVRPHYNISSLKEATFIVNNRAKIGATLIKQYNQKTRLQRQLLLLACNQAGVNMTNEAEQNPLYCLGMIKDGSTGIEHNAVWGDVYNDVVSVVGQSGTYLTPTLQVCYGREQGKMYFRKKFGQTYLDKFSDMIPNEAKEVLRAEVGQPKFDSSFLDQSKIDRSINKANGRIVLGSHGEDQGIGVHYELWALQMGGLTNLEALQTATITAAEGLGMQNDLGSIEVGKIADLIILDKNPLDDIHNSTSVQFVIKAGIIYDIKKLKTYKKRLPH
jgi:Tol biopolymer transport system component